MNSIFKVIIAYKKEVDLPPLKTCFIVGNDKRGPVDLFNHVGQREGLAAAGNP